MSNITYHSLHDYVGGKCITQTFDLNGVTHEEHLTQIGEWLNSITEERQDGELREEWIVCDYDDIPSEFVGEYEIDASFFDLMEAIDNSCYDADVFYAGVALGLTFSEIEDSYFGYFSDYEELGEHLADDLDIPSHLQMYFDHEHYGRDQSHNYSEFDGYYFY